MEQKITFTNSNGVKLVGILATPKQNKGDLANTPVVILCHGFASNKEGRTRETLQEQLNSKGIAIFRFDFFAHGESGGSMDDITISEGLDDVLCAYRLLKEQGFRKFGLWGCSYGGMAALLAAPHIEKEDNLFVLTLKCPVSADFGNLMANLLRVTPQQWKEQGCALYTTHEGNKHNIKYDFYIDKNNDAGYDAAQKISAPTLIIHGDADTLVPIAQSKVLEEKLQNGKLVTVAGASHFFDVEEHFQQSIKEVVDFIIAHK